tara:strand:+ start:132 stop:884 length:753 start_codon:yes stop_codon:yes gene_type:complete
MIPRIIHQIYFDFKKRPESKNFRSIEEFRAGFDKTNQYCELNKIQHKLWTEQQIDQLIEYEFPDLMELWNSFRYKIQKVDLAKFLILYIHGGIYLDLDCHPIRDINHLFDEPYFFTRWNDSQLPYTACLGTISQHPLFKEIIEHCKYSTYQKQEMNRYDTWHARLIFQTTGHFMLQRVLKKNKIQNYKNIMFIYNTQKNLHVSPPPNQALFADSSASVWYTKDDIVESGEYLPNWNNTPNDVLKISLETK